MEEKGNDSMGCGLDDAGAEVVTTLAGHIAKKLPKKIKCKAISKN